MLLFPAGTESDAALFDQLKQSHAKDVVAGRLPSVTIDRETVVEVQGLVVSLQRRTSQFTEGTFVCANWMLWP